MNIREVVGLLLLVVSLILFPFGYWLHDAWYLVSVILVCIGAFFFFTHRMSKKLRKPLPDTDHLRDPLVRDDLQGFPGGRIRDTHKADSDIDIDADGE